MATLTPLTEADKQIHVAGNFVTSIDNDHLINQHFLHENSAMKLFQTGTTTNTVSNNIEDVINSINGLLTEFFVIISISYNQSTYKLIYAYNLIH